MIEVQALARGCAEIITCDDEFLFLSRFTARQLEEYQKTPAYTVCSTHTAGVRLSFLTDGDELRFLCRLPPRINVVKFLVSSAPSFLAALRNGSDFKKNRWIRRNWITYSLKSAINMNVFELQVDGEHVGLFRAVNGPMAFTFDNPDRALRRVDLYFPVLEGAMIKDLEINGRVEPVARPLTRLLCLGDSITHGCLATCPSKTYVNRLAEGLAMDTINQGVAGCTHLPLHLTGIESIPKPDLITVAYGTNDWFSIPDYEDIRQNIHDYYERLNNAFPGCPMVAISPIWRADMDEIRPCGEFEGIRKIIEEETADWPNMSVIDGLTISPADSAYFGDEYLHPNDAGFAWMAERLIPLLKVL